MLSIIIPSKTERFLKRTIEDVLEKATGEIEIFPILNQYILPASEMVSDPRVHYVILPEIPGFTNTKRQSINLGVSMSKGEYVMSLDAHCMMAPGFDTQLTKDHQPYWVQVPRRNRLDPIAWSLQAQVDKRPPIDYEYIIYQLLEKNKEFHGFKWDDKTNKRMDIPIDDIIEFQGSCWFMTKDWFNEMGFMQIEGYTGWGQEAEEISLTTWFHGGRVVVNKNTWYAHLHKGPTFGRMYHLSQRESKRSYQYAYDLWAVKNREFYLNLIEKFMPMPGWPSDWREKI